MTDQNHILQLPDGSQVDVTICRDRRLKKSARWQREPDGTLLLRIPFRYPKKSLPELLNTISIQVFALKEKSNASPIKTCRPAPNTSTAPISAAKSAGRLSAGSGR
jgi:hypothetical protein